MTKKHRATLIESAAVCGPLAVLAAAHLVFTPLPPAPDPTGAAGITPAKLSVTPVRTLSAAQARALEWSAAQQPGVALTSPMDHPTSYEAVAPVTTQIPEPIAVEPSTDPAVQALASLRLTAVVGNAQGGLAMINGKVYKIGDTVRPGITITEIDVQAGTAVCKAANGSTRTLKRPL